MSHDDILNQLKDFYQNTVLATAIYYCADEKTKLLWYKTVLLKTKSNFHNHTTKTHMKQQPTGI